MKKRLSILSLALLPLYAMHAAAEVIILDCLPGGASRVQTPVDSAYDAVSADGSTVVGRRPNADGYGEAFRWTEADGMVALGDLAWGYYESLGTVLCNADEAWGGKRNRAKPEAAAKRLTFRE